MRKLRSRKAETDGGKRFLRARRNPADVPVRALNESDLDSKVVEGLPWLVAKYPNMDWEWAVRNAQLLDRQKRKRQDTGTC
jgi:hypothetical protein